jgi:hypothetical protein
MILEDEGQGSLSELEVGSQVETAEVKDGKEQARQSPLSAPDSKLQFVLCIVYSLVSTFGNQ